MNGYLAQIAARISPIAATVPLVQPAAPDPLAGAVPSITPDPFADLPPAPTQAAPTDDRRPATEAVVNQSLYPPVTSPQASAWLAPAYLDKHVGRSEQPVTQSAASLSSTPAPVFSPPPVGFANQEGSLGSSSVSDPINRYSPDEPNSKSLPAPTPLPSPGPPVSVDPRPQTLITSVETLRPGAGDQTPVGLETIRNVPAPTLLPSEQARASAGTLPMLLPTALVPPPASQAPTAPLVSIGRISVEVILPALPPVARVPRRPAPLRPAPAGDPFKLSFGFGQL